MDSHTVTLVERMYWQHGYSVEDIVQRLRLTPKLVEAITSIDYTYSEEWDEDTNTYKQVRTKRIRKTPLYKNEDTEQMIFPDRPKRINFEQAHTYEALAPDELASSVQTPLRASTDMSAAAWLAHSDKPRDPAASPHGSVAEWLEITAIAVAFCLWITYWRGVHIGAW